MARPFERPTGSAVAGSSLLRRNTFALMIAGAAEGRPLAPAQSPPHKRGACGESDRTGTRSARHLRRSLELQWSAGANWSAGRVSPPLSR